jgi:hypothetical protein
MNCEFIHILKFARRVAPYMWLANVIRIREMVKSAEKTTLFFVSIAFKKCHNNKQYMCEAASLNLNYCNVARSYCRLILFKNYKDLWNFV